jgi:hypothetical protein
MSADGKNVRLLFSQFKILMKDLEHEARTAVLASFGGLPHVSGKPLDEEYWLERAREAYAQAEQLAYPAARRIMLEIAAGYQRLAHSTQERTGRAKHRSS